MTAANETIETPRKSETLVNKFAERSARHKLLYKVRYLPSKNLIRIGEVVFLFAVFAVNFWLLGPFFGHEDLYNINVFSAPLIPLLSYVTGLIIPYTYAVRIWLLSFMISFPILFYFFVKEITRRRLTAMVASLIISLPVGFFLSLRVYVGLLAADGGQVASLTITVVTCLTLFQFLRTGNFNMGIATSLGMALIALISPLGFIIMLLFALSLTFSEMLLGVGRLKLFRFITISVLAAGFCAFWYNPKFIVLTLISPEGRIFLKALWNLFPLSFFLIPLLGTFGFLLFENRPLYQPLFLSIFLSFIFGMLSLGTGSQITTPSRFLPAFGVGLAFLASVVFAKIYDHMKDFLKSKRIAVIYRYRKVIPVLVITFTFLALFFTIEATGNDFRNFESRDYSQDVPIKPFAILNIQAKSGILGTVLGAIITISTVGLTLMLRTKFNQNKPEELVLKS